MNVLAFDVALGKCSVTLLNKGKVLEKKEEDSARQAEVILPMLENMLKKAGIEYENLDLLALTIGPGSFTGLRVGIAVAKMISLITYTPVYAASTLEVFAYQAMESNKNIKSVTVIQDAYRGEVYIQNFINDNGLPMPNIMQPMLVSAADIEKYTISGSFICGNYGDKPMQISSTSLAELATLKKDKAIKAGELKPLYIRKPDAKLPAVG